MATKLSIASAKEYVRGYYDSHEDKPSYCIEGAGMIRIDGIQVCRLNVVGDHFGPFAVQWDVFEEDDGEGSVYLRGEF